MATRVLVVESQEPARENLCAVLEAHGDVDVVGKAADGRRAIPLAEATSAETVLMGVDSTPRGDADVARVIEERPPHLGVVVLTGRDGSSRWRLDRGHQRDHQLAPLLHAIQGAALGLVVIDPAVVRSVERLPSVPHDRLTRRQRDALRLLSEGYDNAGIARRLVINEKSVENLISSLFRRLGMPRTGPSASSGQTTDPRVMAALTFLGTP